MNQIEKGDFMQRFNRTHQCEFPQALFVAEHLVAGVRLQRVAPPLQLGLGVLVLDQCCGGGGVHLLLGDGAVLLGQDVLQLLLVNLDTNQSH